MAKVAFRGYGEIDVPVGTSILEAAQKLEAPEGYACGGVCACSTCHVYVDDAWTGVTGEPSPMEEDMLDFAFDVRTNSRLSCQLKVSEALDGLVVTTPERQA